MEKGIAKITERLTCPVKAGDWGVAYGVALQVITWGEITQVSSDQGSVWIEMEINELPGNCFSRKYVEVFSSKEEAQERFNKLWSRKSEGG